MKINMRVFSAVLLFGAGLSAYAQSPIRGTLSEPSALLGGMPAVANWIWQSGDENPKNTYLLIRKKIEFEKRPDSVYAYISAYSVADVYVNGELTDRCPMNCDPEYQVYEKFNLSRYFHAGSNTITAVVYNFGIGMHHRINARGGFFFQGEAFMPDKKISAINSDGSWRVSTLSGWASDTEMRTGSGEGAPNLIGFIEHFDARKMPQNWHSAGFDDSGWQAASLIGIPPVGPWKSIVTVTRPVLFRETVYPVNQWTANGWVIYDFGREVTGTAVIRLKASKEGADLTLGTAERLLPDGTPDFQRRVRYEDHYITRSGEQQWSPFTWRGFRYVTIPVNPDITLSEISAVDRHFNLMDEGEFECSDPLLTKIYEAGRFTLKLCSQDTYMDTPWREQTQYIAGDSRYLLKYAFYASGLSSEFLTRYNILSGAWSQRWAADGSIRSRYPTDWLIGEGTSGYLIDYELEWVIMLGEYLDYFGKSDLVRQVYPNLVKLMAHFETLIGKEHGVLSDIPGWIVLDHPDTYPMDQTEEINGLNCLYYAALNTASRLAAEVMADPVNGEKWKSDRVILGANIKKWMWSPEKKLYADSYGSSQFSQQTQVYALLYGLVNQEDIPDVTRYITDQGRKSEMSFAYYVVGSVFDREPQWALDYIRKNWGDQMKLASFNGGWQEGWNVEEWTGDIGSTSHAWCSGPTALLPQKVLGAEPLKPGWKEFRIAPHPGDLTWARGVVPTPLGSIMINWSRNNTRISLSLEVPRGSRALIDLPGLELRVNGQVATGPVWVMAGEHQVEWQLFP